MPLKYHLQFCRSILVTQLLSMAIGTMTVCGGIASRTKNNIVDCSPQGHSFDGSMDKSVCTIIVMLAPGLMK